MAKSGKITKTLRKFDVFGQPVQLYIKGKKLHQTREGGVVTLLMITALLFLFFYSLANLIDKKNVYTQEQTSYEKTPPLLDINRENFMFSFGPGDPKITQNNSIFGYKLALVTVFNQEDVEEEVVENTINFGPCNPEDFSKFTDSKKLNALTRTFCPQNFSFPIQGDTDDEIYQYINLNIVECVNNTQENITCASPEQITQYFQDTPMVTFDLYFINRAIDSYDFNDPYKEFIDVQTWTVNPLGSLSRISTISFRSMEILSYDDIFGIKDPTTYNTVGFAQDRTDLSFVPLKNTTSYFNLNLKSSNYKKTCYRNYGTILQVISFVGGLFNLMHLFLGVITTQISNHIYQVKMANKMYSFNLSNVYENKSEQTSEIKEEHPPPDENDPSYWKSLIQKKFEKSRLLRTSLIYQTLEYIKSFFCCLTSDIIKKKNELFNIANKKISLDMDVGVIMRKLQDIEKLKQILLTPEQLSIFNFIPSPAIAIDSRRHLNKRNTIEKINDEDTILIGSGINNLCDDLKQYHKHIRMYNKLKKNSNPVNDNILTYLSPEIKEILDDIEKANEVSIRKTEENQDLLLSQEIKLDLKQVVYSNHHKKTFYSSPLTTKQVDANQATQTNFLSESINSKSNSFILKGNKIDLDASIERSARALY